MARVNSLLSILMSQGGNELRLVSEREPKMLAFGAPKRLSIPAMSDDTVRAFLGELLTDETETELRANGRVDLRYEADDIGTFHVMLTPHAETGVCAVFTLAGAHAGSSASSASSAGRAHAEASAKVADAEHASPRQSDAESSQEESRRDEIEPRTHARTAAWPPRHVGSAALASLLARAVAMRASDVHLADGEPPAVRVDGALRKLEDAELHSVGELLGLLGGAESMPTHAASFDASVEIPEAGRARIHVFTTSSGLAAAVRLIPPEAPSFASLDMPVAFDDVIGLPHGLVLVCGATGSGKSTTLAALAQEALRRRSVLLVTLEDPIEYKLMPSSRSLLRRRQIGRDVSDFARGLRDALREDPDVLVVGELRDAETIALALTAAETGHLVLASIHSRGTASAVERIIDTYPAERQTQVRAQLAESLRLVIGQRLLPRARGSGRIPAVELLRVTRGVASLIREGKLAQLATALQTGRKDGSMSLERSLADRVKAGEIRVEDARASANDPEALLSLLRGNE